MKKILIAVFFMALAAAGARAGSFLTLNYNYTFTGENPLLSSTGARTPYLNGEGGWLFDWNMSASFKYDHITMEDFEYAGNNARVVAVIPALGLGYAAKFWDDRLLLWLNAYAGYAVSVRYRLDAADHKANTFSPSLSAAIYYNVKGQFYAGLETGYRFLKVKYTDLAGEPELDLSGIFCGVSLKHIFE